MIQVIDTRTLADGTCKSKKVVNPMRLLYHENMTKEIKFTTLGDDGYTSLLGSGRFPKSDLRFEVLGCLDESSAVLGLAKSLIEEARIKDTITTIQRDLYHLMGEFSDVADNQTVVPPLTAEHVTFLEDSIASLSREVENPSGFILPGDTISSAAVDLARTTIRRAERRIAQAFEQELIDNLVIRQYINRLSSLLFILELYLIRHEGKSKLTLAK